MSDTPAARSADHPPAARSADHPPAARSADHPPAARNADHPIDPIFLERWSPRAFTGEALPRPVLMSMLEAARWSASSYNSQPWRFLYAIRDTESFPRFLGLLGEFNRSWAHQAGALICLVSKSTMLPPGRDEEVPSHSHSSDAGAAYAAFSLQAVRLGWHTHAMVGFDIDGAFAALRVPPGHRVELMAAIGRRADPSILPEAVRARETPNGRNPVSSFAFEGGFPPA